MNTSNNPHSTGQMVREGEKPPKFKYFLMQITGEVQIRTAPERNYKLIMVKETSQPSATNLKDTMEPNYESKRDKSEGDEQYKDVWFCQMFRFATKFDIILMICGTIGAIAMGVAFPAFAYIWGDMIDSF